MAQIIRVGEANWPLFDALLRRRATGENGPVRACTAPAALNDPNLHLYMSAENGVCTGWISLVKIPKVSWTTRGHLYVDELWVAEEYRRRGHARLLMDKAEEVARELGAEGLRLYVNVNNPGAAALYRRCGYEVSGTADFMEKPL